VALSTLPAVTFSSGARFLNEVLGEAAMVASATPPPPPPPLPLPAPASCTSTCDPASTVSGVTAKGRRCLVEERSDSAGGEACSFAEGFSVDSSARDAAAAPLFAAAAAFRMAALRSAALALFFCFLFNVLVLAAPKLEALVDDVDPKYATSDGLEAEMSAQERPPSTTSVLREDSLAPTLP
ncbi:unnamed protein product, partial [Ectocarpus sp. 8 AP-2014]